MAMISFDEAKKQLLALAKPVAESETLDLLQAGGRVLAQDLVAPMDVPPFTNSAMDGYAVRACDVGQEGVTLPISQRITAGQAGTPLQAGTAARIFTGAPLPDGADTVIMQEHTTALDGAVRFDKAPKLGQNVRVRGGELKTGQPLMAAGTPLTPAALGSLAAMGIAQVPVTRRLRVALFFTGNELRAPGQIYNSNRYIMRGLLEQLGVEIDDLGIIPDDREATRAAVRRAASADVILTSGGMSVGEEDYVAEVVKEEGRLDVWKIAIKPGKPLAFGHVGQAVFIGLPGNPVAVWTGLMTLVQPFLRRCQGLAQIEAQPFMQRADFEYLVKGDRPEFIRVRRNAHGGLDIARTQDSSAISSAAWADGLVLAPPCRPIQSGDMVLFQPVH